MKKHTKKVFAVMCLSATFFLSGCLNQKTGVNGKLKSQ